MLAGETRLKEEFNGATPPGHVAHEKNRDWYPLEDEDLKKKEYEEKEKLEGERGSVKGIELGCFLREGKRKLEAARTQKTRGSRGTLASNTKKGKNVQTEGAQRRPSGMGGRKSEKCLRWGEEFYKRKGKGMTSSIKSQKRGAPSGKKKIIDREAGLIPERQAEGEACTRPIVSHGKKERLLRRNSRGSNRKRRSPRRRGKRQSSAEGQTVKTKEERVDKKPHLIYSVGKRERKHQGEGKEGGRSKRRVIS